VAAVDARAIATLGLPPEANTWPTPAEVLATWRLAQAELSGLPDAPPHIDVRALRDPSGAQKLGLGSSAAAAAAAAGLALVSAGHALEEPSTRETLFRLAFRGHRAIAPEGSGADVAAASWGGFVRFEPAATGSDEPPLCREVGGRAAAAQEGTHLGALHTRVVWTGHAARTSELVGQVRRYEARDAEGFKRLLGELAEAATEFAASFEAGDIATLLALVERYHEGMRALGDAADAPIVEARLKRVARLAKESGGRAKPSGAGGGDVAIAFFGEADDAARFDASVAAAGLETLPLRLGAPGPMQVG
jgi:phosphomevalonate kinase